MRYPTNIYVLNGNNVKLHFKRLQYIIWAVTVHLNKDKIYQLIWRKLCRNLKWNKEKEKNINNK